LLLQAPLIVSKGPRGLRWLEITVVSRTFFCVTIIDVGTTTQYVTKGGVDAMSSALISARGADVRKIASQAMNAAVEAGSGSDINWDAGNGGYGGCFGDGDRYGVVIVGVGGRCELIAIGVGKSKFGLTAFESEIGLQ
jgi:hypothetical protein